MAEKSKMAWCVLHTDDITADKLRNAQNSDFVALEPEDIENLLKAYKAINGAKVVMILDEIIPGDGGYHLSGWNDDQDEKMMMFFYYLEQEPFTGIYLDDFKRFKKDWKSKEYESDGSISFKPENVEIIENFSQGGNHEKLSQ